MEASAGSDDQTKVQIEVDELSNLEQPIHFIRWHTVPTQLHLIRDVGKEDLNG